MHAAVGGAAWRGEGAGQGMSGGRPRGEEGSPAETAERRGSHPEERTFQVDLVEREKINLM